ncbi:MAG: hypothetical protein JRF37_08565, partial [Deltaproteobacteria bacterium]|nr:hypothetical protein [Deltaproteobacteria bacterium]
NSDVSLLKLDTNGEIPGCDLMGTSDVVASSTSAMVLPTDAEPNTISFQVEDTTISFLDTSAVKSVACDSLAFNVKQLISCGGYLDKTQDGVLADTFVTVTHGNNRWPGAAKIIVYDKYGERVAEQPLINGGGTLENNKVPVNGLGWITLGMVVYRVTNTPFGSPGGERFSFQIATGRSVKPSVIEVKQVVYNSRQIDPEKAIWNTANIASWSESALGGKEGTGVVKYTD